ncbi:MAG TPA: YiiX/YebB-like N1pC/P60 family cysteine hydrolase [Flavobacteriales bacterium]|nr:YiiX/YebB-like N1pC/P60 family cysteine hydrolase [Flavobacteriales bacterium]
MNKCFALLCMALLACGNGTREDKNLRNANGETIDKTLDYRLETKGYKNGDILFITCKSDLSSPISQATNSEYTHCGVFVRKKEGAYILEAFAGVELTPFSEFMQNRVGDLLLVMRLKEREKLMGKAKEPKFLKKGMKWLGKEYDGSFMWSDESLYCSELVFKMYEAIGVELCATKKLKEFDFSSPEVKAELQNRYGGEIPMEEPVVAPVDLIYSTLLDTVYYRK